MNYTAKHISNLLKNDVDLPQPDCEIQTVQIDTRIIKRSVGCLFAAISTEKNNGHEYIAAAHQKGVRNFLVQENKWINQFKDSNFFLVKNVIDSLQYLAKIHRESYSNPVFGVTGSNGKTIVKEWIAFLLSQAHHIHKSPGSYNSQIGVPLSIFPLNNRHEFAILEAGISQKNEMEKLAEMIQCEIGVFTFLGSAHAVGFNSEKEKLAEKLTLFKHAQKIVYPFDNQIIRKGLSRFSAKLFGWSRTDSNVFLYLKKETTKYDGTSLEIVVNGVDKNLWLPFRSTALIDNAITALVTVVISGMDLNSAITHCANLPEVDMRLRLSKGISNTLLVHDYYNADWHGLEVALDFMQLHAEQRKRILILSELKNIHLSTEEIYTSLQELFDANKFDQFIGIGLDWKPLNFEKVPNFESHNSINEFLDQLTISAYSGAIILLKGARTHRFEQLSRALRLQEHSARLEVNLTTLKHNLDFFRSQLRSSTKLMVMVKASAYGSGSAEVSSVLAYNNVDYLCVAYVDEGIDLRRKGIQLPIMVLNAEEESFQKMEQYDLEPEIYKFSQLTALQDLDSPLPIHLKLNTGMNRLGFGEEEIEKLILQLKTKRTTVRSLFSHLASSEQPSSDTFTEVQIERFTTMANLIESEIKQKPLRHILNTNGIIRFPAHQMDMVRLGIGLYGLGVPSSHEQSVQSIFSLKARISQLRNIQTDESVGYNREFIASKPCLIAIINIGYADGLLRLAGNGSFSVLVNGTSAPIVGNICMDMCMIDVSGIKDVKEGDSVEIFASYQDIKQLAECLQTIPYEVLTNISSRIPRIYLTD